MVTFDNPRRSYCERDRPFAVFRDNKNDYFDATIPIGLHTVTATPFYSSDCKGPAGTKISKSFELDGCESYYNFYDFNNNSTEPIYRYLDFDLPVPACGINIEVSPYCGFDIGLVEIKIRSTTTNQIVQTQKEVEFPYLVFGNRDETINQGSFNPGNYTIEFTIDGILHTSRPFSAIDEGTCKWGWNVLLGKSRSLPLR